ncbi:TolC family protein [Candidatus Hydrogenedentota bacterium]
MTLHDTRIDPARFAVGAAILVALLGVTAGATAEPVVLTMDKSLGMALDNNPEILEAWHKIQQTETGDEMMVRSRFFPQIELIARKKHTQTEMTVATRYFDPEDTKFRFENGVERELDDTQFLLSFSQRILEFGKDPAEEVTLRESQRDALYGFEDTLRDVLSQVRKRFQVAILKEEQVASRTENYKEFVDRCAKLIIQMTAGGAPEEDPREMLGIDGRILEDLDGRIAELKGEMKKLEHKAMVSTALSGLMLALQSAYTEKQGIIGLEAEAQRAKFDLLKQLGEPIDREIVLHGGIDGTLFAAEQAVLMAVENDTKISRLIEENDEQKRVIKEIAWEWAPDISMDMTYDSRRNSVSLVLENTDDTWHLDVEGERFFSPGDSRRAFLFTVPEYEEQPPPGFIDDYAGTVDAGDSNFSAMFEISFPLFEGFNRVGKLKREREILNQIDSSLVNRKLSLDRDIRKAIESIKEAQFDMIIAEQRADLAKKQLNHQQELYDLGLKNVTDQQLDQFRNQYFNQISAKFTKQEELITARENLRRLMGYFEEGPPEKQRAKTSEGNK